MLLPQKDYARLNGLTLAQVTRLRKEGYIREWIKKPNGRIMIAADARTRFHRNDYDSLEALREAWEWLRIHGDYKYYVLARRAIALALESAMELDLE